MRLFKFAITILALCSITISGRPFADIYTRTDENGTVHFTNQRPRGKSRGKYKFSDGRGFGHGVGMCQCGAEGMARAGAKTDNILSYYYPGSKIKKLY